MFGSTRRGTAALAASLAVVFCGPRGMAQVVVSGTSSQVVQSGSAYVYSQNFDSLGSVSGSWADNSTLPGWYAAKQTAPTAVTSYTADNGSLSAGSLYSYGSTGAADRALGTIRSPLTGNLAYAVVFQNQTGSPLNVTVAYTGEHWRNGGNQNQTLDFTTLVSPTNITNIDASLETGGGFTAFNGLDFITPTHSPGKFALDGNAAANRTALSGTLTTTVNPGEYLSLRWFDLDSPGREHGVGVDDLAVTFTPVPEPTGLVAAAMAGLGLVELVRRRRVRRMA